MEECDLIENEFERMLNAFKEAVTVLNQPPGNPVEQSVLQDLSKNISSASKRIDEIVDNSKMFDQTEEELDDKLRQLDEENKRNQEQFQQVKTSTGKFICSLCEIEERK